MNIHFKNEDLFNELLDSTVATIKVGSHMYNLDNKNSDVDLLHIYVESPDNRNSFMWEHHQLQHKKDGVDHNFTTLQSFIRNTMTGDATINFEVLFSEGLKNSDLGWLYEFRHSFMNYNIIKSYLGFAKRDLKQHKKETKNLRIHTEETNKKLSHFVRGVIFARMLLDNNFVVNMKNTTTFKDYTCDLELLKEIKTVEHDKHLEICDFFERKMNDMRDELNNRLQNNEIDRFMDVSKMQELDIATKNYTKNKTSFNQSYDSLFYEALENGVQY